MRLEVPFWAQTTDFTCGPASLMMALAYFDPELRFSQETEIEIWRQSTLGVFRGTCRYGLALAALERGLDAKLVTNRKGIAYECAVAGLCRTDRAQVDLLFRHMRRKALDAGVEETVGSVEIRSIGQHLASGRVPIVLVNARMVSDEDDPHWLVATGVSKQTVTVNDPLNRETGNMKPIARARFSRWLGYKGGKCAVFIGRGKR